MTLALKEWPATIQALDQGETILLIRKGGIHDKNAKFSLPVQQGFLFPAFEHQNIRALKSQSVAPLKTVNAGDIVTIQNWVEFTDSIEIHTPEVIEALSPHHIWTNAFIQQRYHWKPQRPLCCLLCRTYRLTDPIEISYQSHYGGCRSWFEIDDEIQFTPCTPVLSESDFMAKSKTIHTILQEKNNYIE